MIQNKSKSENDIEWDENALPVSTRFDDPYYSRADGRAETGHVFINGNNLAARWPQMTQCTIAELGFGTGLNFTETVRQWRAVKPAEAQLQFISFEQYPMSCADMFRALSQWPELDDLAKRTVELWSPDFEILDEDFAEDVRLTVFMSDANVRLPQLQLEADAWYLDGFSPAKNPQLWNEELLQHVYAATKPGGSFATYSAAGAVRRNLEAAGFSVERRDGFGTKREMLAGTKPS